MNRLPYFNSLKRRKNALVLLFIFSLFTSWLLSHELQNYVAHAAEPTYREKTVDGAFFKYVAVPLTDTNINFYALTADNAIPKSNGEGYAAGGWADGKSHRQKILDMYNQWGTSPFHNKIAAINTDYFSFNDGAPQGELVRDGTRYQWNHNRAVMRIFPWDGTKYPVYFSVSSRNLSRATTAVGGAPIIRIESNGAINYNPQDERTDEPKSITYSGSRTSACVTSSGNTLYLITSFKATGTQVGNFFKSVGCKRGMEFDGSGSTTLVYKGQLKQQSESNQTNQRPVGSGLLVKYYTCTTSQCPR